MVKKLDYYADLSTQVMEDDEDRDSEYDEIDKAFRCEYDFPKKLVDLDWVGMDRLYVSTALADAKNAAVRTFATRLPNLHIAPMTPDDSEYDRMESMEELMEGEFERMNRFGMKSPHWRAVEEGIKYHAVAIQTEYLPFKYKTARKNARLKALLDSRSFSWKVHKFPTVHTVFSDDLLEVAFKASNYTAKQLKEMFQDNADDEGANGVKEMLKKLKEDGKDADESALQATYYTLYDLSDWKDRVQWAVPANSLDVINREADGDAIEFMRKAHGLPFINWAIVNNGDPIWLAVIKSKLWDRLNILQTLDYAMAIDMVAEPSRWIRTATGTLDNVHMDNSSPNQPLVTDKSVEVAELSRTPENQQIAKQVSVVQSEVYQSTVSRILADVQAIGSPNATLGQVNAMMNAAIGQLSLASNTIERAEAMAFYQNFQWIDYSDISLVGARRQSSSEEKIAGEHIGITKDSFDLPHLLVNVKLHSTTITDKQAEVTNAINEAERLGLSKELMCEEIGVKNWKLHQTKRAQEALVDAEIQRAASDVLNRAQIAKMQEALGAMQQNQTQLQEQMKGMDTAMKQMRNGLAFEGAQGIDTRTGAISAQSFAPTQTREMGTGMTQSGQGLA